MRIHELVAASLLILAGVVLSGGVLAATCLYVSNFVPEWLVVFCLCVVIAWMWLVNIVVDSNLGACHPEDHALRLENARLLRELERVYKEMARAQLASVHWQTLYHRTVAMYKVARALRVLRKSASEGMDLDKKILRARTHVRRRSISMGEVYKRV